MLYREPCRTPPGRDMSYGWLQQPAVSGVCQICSQATDLFDQSLQLMSFWLQL